MFCPTCGANVQEGAKFCPRCGTTMNARAAYSANPQLVANQQQATPYRAPQQLPTYGSQQQPGMGGTGSYQAPYNPASGTNVQDAVSSVGRSFGQLASSVGFNIAGIGPFGIAARAAAIVAVVLMFLPWIKIPALSMANSFGSGLGIGIKESYTIPELKDICDMLKSAMAPYAGYMESEEMAQVNSVVTVISILHFLWLAVIVALVVGIVLSLIKNRRIEVLVAAGAATTVLGIAFLIGIAYANGQLSAVSEGLAFAKGAIGVHLAILAGAATTVCALLDHGARGVAAQPMAYAPSAGYTPRF